MHHPTQTTLRGGFFLLGEYHMLSRQRLRRRQRKINLIVENVWLWVIMPMGLLAGFTVMAIVMAEIMVGCGEPNYHQDGTFTTEECLVIPYEPVQGRWK